MAVGANGATYIAAPAYPITSPRLLLPPGNTHSILPPKPKATTYIARVRPEGDGVFWTMAVPMYVQDLKVDGQGNILAAGFATRSDVGSGPLVPCLSSLNPVADPNPANLSLGLLKLSAEGTTALAYSCIGSGWQTNSPPNTVSIALNEKGDVYLSGTAYAFHGFTSTLGALISSPPDTRGTRITPYALRLSSDLKTIRYATWLPGETVNSAIVDAAGNLTYGGSINESTPLPVTPGAAQSVSGGSFLMRTDDGGATFHNAAAGLPTRAAVIAMARHNSNALAATVYMDRTPKLYMTTDGGATWTEVALPAGADLSFQRADLDDSGQMIYLLGRNGNAALALFRFAKGEWTRLALPPMRADPHLAMGADAELYLLGDINEQGIWFSSDAGSTWTAAGTAKSLDLPAAHPADGRILYTIRQSEDTLTYLTSSDAGRTWVSGQPVSLPRRDALGRDSRLILHPAQAGVLFAIGNDTVYRSRDSGQSWEKFPNVPCAQFANPPSKNILICGNGSEQYDLLSQTTQPFAVQLGGRQILFQVLAGPSDPSRFYLVRQAGQEGFVCQINPEGTHLNFCTYLGGSGGDSVTKLAPASNGGFWVAGTSNSRDFPVTSGALQTAYHTEESSQNDYSDATLCHLSADGKHFTACTLFGGSTNENVVDINEDSQGRPVLLGNSDSMDFPKTSNGNLPPKRDRLPGVADVGYGFLLNATADLSQVIFASIVRPQTIWAAARIAGDQFFLAGGRSIPPSEYLRPPFKAGAGSGDVGVVDLGSSLASYILPYGIRETLLNRGLSVTPGGLVRLNGVALASEEGSVPMTGPLPYTLAGARVLLDGVPVPILRVSPALVEFQVPWNAATGVHSVRVQHGSISTTETAIWVFPSAPVLQRDRANSPTSVFNANGSRVDTTHPALPGSALRVIFSGIGAVRQPPPPGKAALTKAPSVLTARAHLGPYNVPVLYAGAAIGYVGMSEAQIMIPADIAPEEYFLRLEVNGFLSDGARIAVGAKH